MVTVFVVEDHQLMRDAICTFLSGHEDLQLVGAEADGLTALHKIEEAKPDVVLMDIGLPTMNGIEVTSRLKETLPSVKVVMFTSHDDVEEVRAALASGASGYCLKELSADEILLAIRSVAQGAAWLAPKVAVTVLTMLSANPAAPLDEKRAKRISQLSSRELEVLKLLSTGKSNKEIASELQIGLSTVRTHVEHILQKLEVTCRTEAAVLAVQERI
ncbi:MAG: response regulator transcription factor [Candidatus Obscuribacterales bacterium]|nr:response regulator transcription factor [Candidatus Obscuribacterales bacterium]